MGWLPVDTATRYAMGLPTMAESEAQANREAAGSALGFRAQIEMEQAEKNRQAQLAAAGIGARAQTKAAAINKGINPDLYYESGGTVKKDPRATRRDYAKGGPVFR